MKLIFGTDVLTIRVLETPMRGPTVQVEYTPPRLKAKRFDVNVGMTGEIVETVSYASQMTEDEKLEATSNVKTIRVLDEFFSDGTVYTPHVRVVSVVFVPKTLHKSVYGSDPAMPKASRSKGTLVLEFMGDPKERWGAYLTVVGFERAMRNPEFVTFCSSR